MFEPRARVPHFVVRTVDGATVDYRSIWQMRHLLLISLDDAAASGPFVAVADDLAARRPDLDTLQASLVVTRDPIVGVSRPGVVVADRWGDIYATIDGTALTDADDLLDWVGLAQKQCS